MARIQLDDGTFVEVEDLSDRDAATDDEAASAEWGANVGGETKRVRGDQLGGTADTTDIEATLAKIEALIADLKLETPPFWETATSAVLGLFDSRNTLDAAAINAYTNWTATPTIPANIPTLFLVARLPEGTHPGDYRIKPIQGVSILLNGTVPITDAALTGFDYYPVAITVGGRGRAVGQTLTLEQHGADIHTLFLGALVKDRIIEAVREILLPDPSTGVAGDLIERNADGTGYQLIRRSAISGSATLSTQLQQTIENLIEKTLDLVITKRPAWVAAESGKAQFTSIARGSQAAQHLSNRQVPSTASGWGNDITLTSTRVLLVRIKPTENLSDYQFLFDQPAGVTLNFSALTKYAEGSTWHYYAENTLTNEATGRIRLQHHGADVTSRFIGDLAREKVIAAIQDLLIDTTPQRFDTMPTLMEGQVIYLTQADNSGSTNYRQGTYQGVDQGGTIIPVQVLVPNQEVLLDALQRIVPTVPTDAPRRKLTTANGRMSWELDTASDAPNVEWFIAVQPNYIIKPAFTGIFTIYLHDIATDEEGFDDVRKISIKFSGNAVHSENWRTTDTKRVITLEIDTAEARNLVNNAASATSLAVEVFFQNSSGTDLFSRSFTIAATTTDPNARESNPSYAIFNIDINKSISTSLSSFTFGSTLKRSNNITNVISRRNDGLAIRLTPGTYIIDTHIVVDDSSTAQGNNRANFEVQLWNGTAEIDSLDNVGYVRNYPAPDIESFQTTHTITIGANTDVSVRIKRYSDPGGDLTTLQTVAGGTVTVRKL